MWHILRGDTEDVLCLCRIKGCQANPVQLMGSEMWSHPVLGLLEAQKFGISQF